MKKELEKLIEKWEEDVDTETIRFMKEEGFSPGEARYMAEICVQTQRKNIKNLLNKKHNEN